MKRFALKTLVATILLVLGFASSSHAVMYALEVYTVDTPLGRVGYAELRSTLAYGPPGGTGYFFFGPVEYVPAYELLELCIIAAFVSTLVYLLYARLRQRQYDDAA